MNFEQSLFCERVTAAALPEHGEPGGEAIYMELFGGSHPYTERNRKVGGKMVMILETPENLLDGDTTCIIDIMFCILPADYVNFKESVNAVNMMIQWKRSETDPEITISGRHTLAFDHPFNEYLDDLAGQEHFSVNLTIPNIQEYFLEYVRDYSRHFFPTKK